MLLSLRGSALSPLRRSAAVCASRARVVPVPAGTRLEGHGALVEPTVRACESYPRRACAADARAQLTRVPCPLVRSRRRSPLRAGSSIPDQNYKTAAGLTMKDLELHCQQLQVRAMPRAATLHQRPPGRTPARSLHACSRRPSAGAAAAAAMREGVCGEGEPAAAAPRGQDGQGHRLARPSAHLPSGGAPGGNEKKAVEAP